MKNEVELQTMEVSWKDLSGRNFAPILNFSLKLAIKEYEKKHEGGD